MNGSNDQSLPSIGQVQPEVTPFLFSPETIKGLTEEEREGRYTLERLRQLRPEVIPEVVRLRGEHCGLLRISRIVKMHHRTVSAICAEYPEQIAKEQQRRVNRLRSAADKLVELVDDAPESVPPNVRALAASQLIDKAQLLSGGSTANLAIDIRSRAIDIDGAFQKFAEVTEEIERLRKAGRIDIDRVKELGWKSLEALEQQTGLGGEIKSSIRDATAVLPGGSGGEGD